nr:integrin alpha-8-like [Lytechinus pictus]
MCFSFVPSLSFRLLVGAPRAQTNQPGVVAGGALYKCPLRSLSTYEDCHQVSLDPEGNLMQNGEEITNKSGQMFGATVHSGGADEPVVVCSPLFTRFIHPTSSESTTRDPIGACLITKRNFTEIHEFMPCNNTDSEASLECQAGLSAAVADGEILVGAAGNFKAKGQVHLVSLYDGQLGSFSSGEPKLLKESDYKGYSVAFADFDGDTYYEYVVGTPRAAQNRGTVSILGLALDAIKVMEGFEMGEYFGHSIVGSDLNGDGYDDMIVSAPMYSNMQDKRHEVGRVYIYTNNRDGTFEAPQLLEGKQAGGRFGFSIASLGDANRDGFKDLAVGAPHEGETGLGRVYIFHSSGREGLYQSATQVLDPLTLGLTLTTFGFSLSSGMDMDNNQYPDLAVGMYKASTVALFRSRPVVNVSSNIIVDLGTGIRLKERNYRLLNGALVLGFNVTLCLSFDGINVPDEITLDYELIADAKLPVSQRCYFELLGQPDAASIQDRVTLSTGTEICLSHVAYIPNSIQDKLTPITMRANYTLITEQLNGTLLEPADIQPILNNNVPASASLTVPILRNCQNATCVPDLRLSVTKNLEKLFVGDRKNIIMIITITNYGEDAYQSKLRIHTPTELVFKKAEQLRLTHDFISSCSNDLQLSLVTCSVGNPLPADSELKLRVEFENVNLSGQVDLLTFSMQVQSVEAERQNTRRDNQMDILIPVEIDASMELIGLSNPQEVIFHPEKYPIDRSINSYDDIGPEISHYFSLINKGPSHIGPATVHIEWPLFTNNGSILLLLTKASMNNGQMCTVNAYVSPAKLPMRTDVMYEDTGFHPDQSYCRDVTRSLMSRHLQCCSLGNCATITCRLDSLLATSSAKGDVVITVKSRLWMNTLIQENVKDLRISSRASAVAKGSYYTIQFDNNPVSNYTITTEISEYVEEEDQTIHIPIWIYIVAASVGLLIVVLLILILWKIGFFKRKKITPEQRKKIGHPESSRSQKYEPYRYTTCRSIPN